MAGDFRNGTTFEMDGKIQSIDNKTYKKYFSIYRDKSK